MNSWKGLTKKLINSLKVLSLVRIDKVRTAYDSIYKNANSRSENSDFTQYKEFLKYFERCFMIDKTDNETKRGFVNAFPIKFWNFNYYTKSYKEYVLINSDAERFIQIQKEHFSIRDKDLESFITALQEWETSQKELYENESKNFSYNQRDVLPENMNWKKWEKRVGIETSYWFRFLVHGKDAKSYISNPDYLFYISDDDKSEYELEEGTDSLPIKIDSQIEYSNPLKTKLSETSKSLISNTKSNGHSSSKFSESKLSKTKEINNHKSSFKKSHYNNLKDLEKKSIEINDTQNSIIEVSAPGTNSNKKSEIYTIETQEDKDYEFEKSSNFLSSEAKNINAKSNNDSKIDYEMEEEEIESSNEYSYIKDPLLQEVKNQSNKDSQPKSKSNESPMKRILKILKAHNFEDFYEDLMQNDISDSNIMKITFKEFRYLGCPDNVAREIYEELHSTVKKKNAASKEEKTITNTQESITQTLDSFQYDSKKDEFKSKCKESVFKRRYDDASDTSKGHKINTPLNKLIGQYKLKKERYLEKFGVRKFKRRRDDKEVRKIIAENSANIWKDEEQRKQFLDQAEKKRQKELSRK